MTLLNLICYLFTFIGWVLLLTGYVYKKRNFCKTLEEGVRLAIHDWKDIFRWVYGKWKSIPTMEEMQVDTRLLFTDKEILKLVEKFGDVYEFPKYAVPPFPQYGLLQVEFTAIGVKEKYAGCTNAILWEIVKHIAEAYFMSIREMHVKVYVVIATQEHVKFILPLNEHERKRLEMEYDSQKMPGQVSGSAFLEKEPAIPPLDETVPEPPEIREGHGLDEEINLAGDTRELP